LNDQRPDVSAFWPNNPYYSGTFILVNGFDVGVDNDRAKYPNYDLWWGVSDNDISQQGPCATGYHIPTQKEWEGLVHGAYNTGIFVWTPVTGWYTVSNQFLQQFINYFQLPLAGGIYRTTALPYNYGIAHYYSSTSSGIAANILRIQNNTIRYDVGSFRAVALPLRCFKNRRDIICDRVTDIPKAECEALVDFYDSTNGDDWTKGFSGRVGEAGEAGRVWRLTGDQVCGRRYGVYCKGNYVKQIRFNDNNLSGTLPHSLAALTRLEDFWVGKNTLKGILPPEYAHRTNLLTINLSENQIEGTLPPAYSAWTNIQQFTAMGNNIEWPLPLEYGNAWGALTLFRV
jgi:hypothetical protein